MFENQCILNLADEAKELRTTAVYIEKRNASAKSPLAKRRGKKRITVVAKCVIALEAELKESCDAEKQSEDERAQSDKRATDAAAQLAEFLLRTTEVKENAKVATVKLVDMKWQMTEWSKAAENTHSGLSKASKCAELLEVEAEVSRTQLRKMMKARDSAVAGSNSRQREVRAFGARLSMPDDELDSLKRRESRN